MYTPTYNTKRNHVPVLSKYEINIMGEHLVEDFCPEALRTPMEIDIDTFTQSYLGLDQEFQFLSHNGMYLGMMVFNDSDRVPVYDPVANRAEYISVRARTIIIENYLLPAKQEHRYRFTMGHEASHAILHTKYFTQDNKTSQTPIVQCRVDASNMKRRQIYHWTDEDWMEWQADKLSAAVLMPVSSIKKLVAEHPIDNDAFKAVENIINISKTFNVSLQAAELRMCDLDLMNGITRESLRQQFDIFVKI